MKIPHSCPDFDKAIECIKNIRSVCDEHNTITAYVWDVVKNDSAGAIDHIESARSVNSSLRDELEAQMDSVSDLENELSELREMVQELQTEKEQLEIKLAMLEE